MAFGELSLKGRALRCLSQREHSRAELQRKLAPHAESGEALAALLDELTQQGFISEQRVAESVLHRRAARLGPARLRQELQAKGLSAEVVQEALASVQDSELARAHAVWQRRFGAPPADAPARARQVRFLMARGFSGSVVRQVVAGLDEDALGAQAPD